MRSFLRPLVLATLVTSTAAYAQAPGEVAPYQPAPPAPPPVAAPAPPPADAPSAEPVWPPEATYAQPAPQPSEPYAPYPQQRYPQQRYEPQRYEPQPYDPYYRQIGPPQLHVPSYGQVEARVVKPPPPLPIVFGTLGVMVHSQEALSGMMLEGGVRPGSSPMWLHGAIETSMDETTSATTTTELRAGLEWRACSRLRHACLIGGADLGYIMMQPMGLPTDTGTAFVPRIGIDTGGRYIRFRAEIQLPVTSGLREYSPDYYYDTANVTDDEHTRLGFATGVGITAQY